MNTLYKTFFGKTIDLSKIISISDVYIRDHEYGSLTRVIWDDYMIGFNIHCQLLDIPIVFERGINPLEGKIIEKEFRYSHDGGGTGITPVLYLMLKNGKYKRASKILKNNNLWCDCVGIQNLQKQVDEFIDVWKNMLIGMK